MPRRAAIAAMLSPSAARASISACRAPHRRLAALVAASRLRLGDALPLALQHDLALKLRDAAQDVEHQAPGRGGAIDAEVQDPQGDIFGLERGDNGAEVGNRTGEAIELGDDEGITPRGRNRWRPRAGCGAPRRRPARGTASCTRAW